MICCFSTIGNAVQGPAQCLLAGMLSEYLHQQDLIQMPIKDEAIHVLPCFVFV